MLWLAALAGLLIYVTFTLQLCVLALAHPYQLDYGEGLVLYQTLRIAHGQSIYKSIDEFPYVFSNYPPLLQTIAGPFVAVLGPSFAPGRLIVLACTLGLALVIYALVRRAGGARLAAAVAALLFLGSPYVYDFAPLFRIDLPALFLSAVGVLILSTVTPPSLPLLPSRRLAVWSGTSPFVKPATARVYLAALFFVLALYTKQSYIAAPAAAAIYFFLNRRLDAVRFIGALLVFGLIPFVVLQLATAGAFAFGLFTANVNPFSLSTLISQIADFVRTFAVLIMLAIIGALGGRQQAASAQQGDLATSARLPGLSFLGWYGLAAIASILLAGKTGAWENYFLEALFVLCVYAGLGINRLLRASPQSPVPIPQSPVPIPQSPVPIPYSLFLPLALLLQLGLMWHDPRIGTRVIDEDTSANRALAPLIARQSGMIVSEDLGLLLVNGQDVPFFSFEYTQLARVGRWDQRWETGTLRKGGFSLVVLEKGTREDPDHYQRFTREFLSAMDTAYGLVAEAGKYRVYAPLPLVRRTDAVLGGDIALLGYRLDGEASKPEPPTAVPGAVTIPPPTASLPPLNPYPPTLRLSLLWHAQAAVTTGYKIFVHLEDAAGRRVAQADGMPLSGLYPTTRWAQGETVRDYYELDLPPDLPPGRYLLRVGMYDPATGQRLAAQDGATSILLAALPLGLDNIAPQPQTLRPATFSDGVRLLGFAAPAQIKTGTPLTLTLYWQADGYIPADDTVFVHLVRGAGGPPLAQADGRPPYPTSIWNPGEYVTDTRVLALPRDLPAGAYQLLVGLYRPPGNSRIPLTGGGDSILLAEIQITD